MLKIALLGSCLLTTQPTLLQLKSSSLLRPQKMLNNNRSSTKERGNNIKSIKRRQMALLLQQKESHLDMCHLLLAQTFSNRRGQSSLFNKQNMKKKNYRARTNLLNTLRSKKWKVNRGRTLSWNRFFRSTKRSKVNGLLRTLTDSLMKSLARAASRMK